MVTYYAKRSLEILREGGPVELSKAIYRFARRRVGISNIHYELRNKIKLILYNQKHEGFADADKIIHINPNDITYGILNPEIKKYETLLLSGDWDKIRENDNGVEVVPCYSNKREFSKLAQNNPFKFYPFENWEHYKSFEMHFNCNVPWEQTEFFKMLMRKPEHDSGKYAEGEMKDRFKTNDKLYESIKNNGYLTEKERRDADNNHSGGGGELGVGITRNGEIIYVRNGATHRFTISRILELDSIPAKVKLRHKKWQELRDEIHNNGLPEDREDLRDHPDLQDVLN